MKSAPSLPATEERPARHTQRTTGNLSRSLTLLAALCALCLGVPCVPSLQFVPTAHAASATRTSTFEYDPATGLLTQEIIEPDNPQHCLATTYTYDNFGNKTSATTASCSGANADTQITSRTSTSEYTNGAVTLSHVGATYSYPAGQFPTVSKNALNHQENKTYDPRFGAVAQLIGPNQQGTANSTQWWYDSLGRKSYEFRADGTRTLWQYVYCTGVGGDTNQTPTVYCLPNGAYAVVTTPLNSSNQPIGAQTAVIYDTLGREIHSYVQGFDGTGVNKLTHYDARGRVLQVSRPYKDSESANVVWTTYTHDDLNRVLTVNQPASASGAIARTTTTYNGLTVTVTVNENGASGNLPGGMQSKTSTKNAVGQTVAVTDTQGNPVYYVFDPFGNLLQTHAAGVVTAMAYDTRGRKVGMTDPNMGSWSYVYNAVGELVRQTDAKGQVSTITYDVLGRMLTRNEPDLNSSWSYDTCGATAKGKLCSATSNNSYSRTHTYDSLGRPGSTTSTQGAAYTFTTTYDSSTGRPALLTYPVSGLIVRNNYNTLGYLKSVSNNATNLNQRARIKSGNP